MPTSPKTSTDLKNGKIFGTAGFVISLIPGAWLASLVFSVVGYKLSKRAGVKNTLAIAGIWISSVFISLLLIGLAAVAILAYTENQNKNRDLDSRTHTSLVESAAVVYWAENGTYPSLAELKASQPFRHLPENSEPPTLTSGSDPASGQIGYVECYDDNNQPVGAEIYYYSHEDQAVKSANRLGEC